MKLGIDLLLEAHLDLLSGRRAGILANAASIGSGGGHTISRLCSCPDLNVTAIFGPEHGVDLKAQDMESVEPGKDDQRKIPIHSLYGKTTESLIPTAEMLNQIDVLVVDLQDIGSRYYTYVWTACLCLKACAKHGKKIIVCDRPNPIGGAQVEGQGIEEGYESFVGLYSIPVRHGMTIGEIVQFVNDHEKLEADLIVMPMKRWRRGMHWPDTGLAWHNPSPNMRSYEAVLLYPGMCLVEGTNLSEGRGTDSPFELIGAPYIDAEELTYEFNLLKLEGIRAEATSFTSTRQKWVGEVCNGVRWNIEDSKTFRPYLTGLSFIRLVYNLYNDKGFEWRRDPYEFVTEKTAIDLLTGSDKFRKGIGSLTDGEIEDLSRTPSSMMDERAKHLMY